MSTEGTVAISSRDLVTLYRTPDSLTIPKISPGTAANNEELDKVAKEKFALLEEYLAKQATLGPEVRAALASLPAGKMPSTASAPTTFISKEEEALFDSAVGQVRDVHEGRLGFVDMSRYQAISELKKYTKIPEVVAVLTDEMVNDAVTEQLALNEGRITLKNATSVSAKKEVETNEAAEEEEEAEEAEGAGGGEGPNDDLDEEHDPDRFIFAREWPQGSGKGALVAWPDTWRPNTYRLRLDSLVSPHGIIKELCDPAHEIGAAGGGVEAKYEGEGGRQEMEAADDDDDDDEEEGNENATTVTRVDRNRQVGNIQKWEPLPRMEPTQEQRQQAPSVQVSRVTNIIARELKASRRTLAFENERKAPDDPVLQDRLLKTNKHAFLMLVSPKYKDFQEKYAGKKGTATVSAIQHDTKKAEAKDEEEKLVKNFPAGLVTHVALGDRRDLWADYAPEANQAEPLFALHSVLTPFVRVAHGGNDAAARKFVEGERLFETLLHPGTKVHSEWKLMMKELSPPARAEPKKDPHAYVHAVEGTDFGEIYSVALDAYLTVLLACCAQPGAVALTRIFLVCCARSLRETLTRHFSTTPKRLAAVSEELSGKTELYQDLLLLTEEAGMDVDMSLILSEVREHARYPTITQHNGGMARDATLRFSEDAATGHFTIAVAQDQGRESFYLDLVKAFRKAGQGEVVNANDEDEEMVDYKPPLIPSPDPRVNVSKLRRATRRLTPVLKELLASTFSLRILQKCTTVRSRDGGDGDFDPTWEPEFAVGNDLVLPSPSHLINGPLGWRLNAGLDMLALRARVEELFGNSATAVQAPARSVADDNDDDFLLRHAHLASEMTYETSVMAFDEPTLGDEVGLVYSTLLTSRFVPPSFLYPARKKEVTQAALAAAGGDHERVQRTLLSQEANRILGSLHLALVDTGAAETFHALDRAGYVSPWTKKRLLDLSARQLPASTTAPEKILDAGLISWIHGQNTSNGTVAYIGQVAGICCRSELVKLHEYLGIDAGKSPTHSQTELGQPEGYLPPTDPEAKYEIIRPSALLPKFARLEELFTEISQGFTGAVAEARLSKLTDLVKELSGVMDAILTFVGRLRFTIQWWGTLLGQAQEDKFHMPIRYRRYAAMVHANMGMLVMRSVLLMLRRAAGIMKADLSAADADFYSSYLGEEGIRGYEDLVMVLTFTPEQLKQRGIITKSLAWAAPLLDPLQMEVGAGKRLTEKIKLEEVWQTVASASQNGNGDQEVAEGVTDLLDAERSVLQATFPYLLRFLALLGAVTSPGQQERMASHQLLWKEFDEVMTKPLGKERHQKSAIFSLLATVYPNVTLELVRLRTGSSKKGKGKGKVSEAADGDSGVEEEEEEQEEQVDEGNDETAGGGEKRKKGDVEVIGADWVIRLTVGSRVYLLRYPERINADLLYQLVPSQRTDKFYQYYQRNSPGLGKLAEDPIAILELGLHRGSTLTPKVFFTLYELLRKSPGYHQGTYRAVFHRAGLRDDVPISRHMVGTMLVYFVRSFYGLTRTAPITLARLLHKYTLVLQAMIADTISETGANGTPFASPFYKKTKISTTQLFRLMKNERAHLFIYLHVLLGIGVQAQENEDVVDEVPPAILSSLDIVDSTGAVVEERGPPTKLKGEMVIPFKKGKKAVTASSRTVIIPTMKETDLVVQAKLINKALCKLLVRALVYRAACDLGQEDLERVRPEEINQLCQQMDRAYDLRDRLAFLLTQKTDYTQQVKESEAKLAPLLKTLKDVKPLKRALAALVREKEKSDIVSGIAIDKKIEALDKEIEAAELANSAIDVPAVEHSRLKNTLEALTTLLDEEKEELDALNTEINKSFVAVPAPAAGNGDEEEGPGVYQILPNLPPATKELITRIRQATIKRVPWLLSLRYVIMASSPPRTAFSTSNAATPSSALKYTFDECLEQLEAAIETLGVLNVRDGTKRSPEFYAVSSSQRPTPENALPAAKGLEATEGLFMTTQYFVTLLAPVARGKADTPAEKWLKKLVIMLAPAQGADKQRIPEGAPGRFTHSKTFLDLVAEAVSLGLKSTALFSKDDLYSPRLLDLLFCARMIAYPLNYQEYFSAATPSPKEGPWLPPLVENLGLLITCRKLLGDTKPLTRNGAATDHVRTALRERFSEQDITENTLPIPGQYQGDTAAVTSLLNEGDVLDREQLWQHLSANAALPLDLMFLSLPMMSKFSLAPTRVHVGLHVLQALSSLYVFKITQEPPALLRTENSSSSSAVATTTTTRLFTYLCQRHWTLLADPLHWGGIRTRNGAEIFSPATLESIEGLINRRTAGIINTITQEEQKARAKEQKAQERAQKGKGKEKAPEGPPEALEEPQQQPPPAVETFVDIQPFAAASAPGTSSEAYGDFW